MRAKGMNGRGWRLAVGGWEYQKQYEVGVCWHGELLRSRNHESQRGLSADGCGVGREEVAAVGGPGVLLGFDAGGLSDLEKLVAMRQRPDELLLDGGGAAWLDK